MNSNSQTELMDKVLTVINHKGILDEIIIVGSWCLYFYRWGFEEGKTLSKIKTKDVDICVHSLIKSPKSVDLPALLTPLDFEIKSAGDNFIFLIHPLLKIEFLSPEKGRGTDEPLRLPNFGITAQPLRFLDLLEKEVITVE